MPYSCHPWNFTRYPRPFPSRPEAPPDPPAAARPVLPPRPRRRPARPGPRAPLAPHTHPASASPAGGVRAEREKGLPARREPSAAPPFPAPALGNGPEGGRGAPSPPQRDGGGGLRRGPALSSAHPALPSARRGTAGAAKARSPRPQRNRRVLAPPRPKFGEALGWGGEGWVGGKLGPELSRRRGGRSATFSRRGGRRSCGRSPAARSR